MGSASKDFHNSTNFLFLHFPHGSILVIAEMELAAPKIILTIQDSAFLCPSKFRASQTPSDHLFIQNTTNRRSRDDQVSHHGRVKTCGENLAIAENSNILHLEFIDDLSSSSMTGATVDNLCRNVMPSKQISHAFSISHAWTEIQYRIVWVLCDWENVFEHFKPPRGLVYFERNNPVDLERCFV